MSYVEKNELTHEIRSTFDQFKETNIELKNEVKKAGQERSETRQKLDRLHDRLDDLETKFNRPKMSVENTSAQSEYAEAWKKWHLHGDDTEIKLITMNETVDPQGGYAVPPEYENIIIESLVQWSPIRRYASKMRVNSKELRIPVQQQSQNLQTGVAASGLFLTGWTADQGPVNGTDAGQLGMKIIPTCDLYALPYASQDMLDDAIVNMDQYIRKNLAKSFAFAEGSAFVNGNGVGKPTGLVTSAAAGDIPTSVTASTGVQYSIGTTPNILIDCFYSLPDFYARNGTWLMNRQTLRIIREWVDGQTQNLWTREFGTAIANEAPLTILGRPYQECIDFEGPSNFVTGAYTAGAIPIMFGDIESAYLITDRLGMSMLRDPYSQKPFVQFYTTFRVGGLTILPEALAFVNVKPT